jgi:predicted MPP superfamily phosphohydrolase
LLPSSPLARPVIVNNLPATPPSSSRSSSLTRRAFLGAGAVGVLGALGATAAGGRGNSLDVVRTTPPDAAGGTPLRIALLTDLHAPHSWVPMDEIAAAVDAFAPHLVLVVGDAIDRGGEEAQLRALGAVRASHGKFASLGNHEYWSGCPLDAIRREYERADVRLLVNQDAAVEIDGRLVHLAGLDDWRAGRPTTRWSPDARRGGATPIPASCSRTARPPSPTSPPAGTLAADVFGGHTHGGQIAPGGVALVLPAGEWGLRARLVPGPAAGQRLYVSRGLGNSVVPFRIGARPELALITL